MSAHQHEEAAHAPMHSAGAYEKSDAQPRPLLIFAIGLIVTTAVAAVSMKWLFDAFNAMESSKPVDMHPLARTDELPPAPRLQPSPSRELGEYQAQLEQTINGYAWIDRDAGIVRIPIDRAMDLVSERGLPHRK
jgi:hypothetical protein